MANRGRTSTYVGCPIAHNRDTLTKAFTFDTQWLADELHNNGLLSSFDHENVSTTRSQMRDSEKSRVLVDSLVRQEQLDSLDSETSRKLLKILPRKRSLYNTAINVLEKTTYPSAGCDDTNIEEEKTCIEEPILQNNASEISQKKPKDKMPGINYESYIQKIQFVLVTRTDNEFNAATMFMIGPDCEHMYCAPSNATKFAEGVYVGIFGKQHVGLLQVSNCTDDLINKLEIFENARYIIALGVCYGFPQKDVKKGDVIISKKIFNLGIFEFDDELKVYPKNYSIHNIHNNIYNIFHSKGKSFEYMDVAKHRKFVIHQGLVVSSPAPIANKKIRDSIYELQAIEQPYGGETQGCDLLKLQEKRSLQIIVIKGVASQGGKCTHDQSWQYTSSKAACYYVQHKLEEYKDLTEAGHPTLETSISEPKKTPPTRSDTATEENLSDLLLKALLGPTSGEKSADAFIKALQNVNRMRQAHSGGANAHKIEETSSDAKTGENWMDMFRKELQSAADTGETKPTSSSPVDKVTTKQESSCAIPKQNLVDVIQKAINSGATEENLRDIIKELQTPTTTSPIVNLMNICQKTLQSKRNRWIAMGTLCRFLSYICYVIAVSLAWVLSLSIFPGNRLTKGGAVIISLPLLTGFAYFGAIVAVVFGKYYFLKLLVICSGVVAVLLESVAAAVLIIAGSQSERPSNSVLSYGLSSGIFAVLSAFFCAISTSILMYVFISDYIKKTK